jgi:hypothetical protein
VIHGRVIGLGVLFAACSSQPRRVQPVAPRDSTTVLPPIHVTAALPKTQRELYQEARRASRDSMLKELAEARQRWARQGGPRVRYRWQEVCYCIFSVQASSDITVEAVRDSIISIVNGRSIASSYESSGRTRPSISYLMSLADKAIRGNADEIIVTFDPLLGIPTRVYVDPIVGMTDDEVEIRITDIHVIR